MRALMLVLTRMEPGVSKSTSTPPRLRFMGPIHDKPPRKLLTQDDVDRCCSSAAKQQSHALLINTVQSTSFQVPALVRNNKSTSLKIWLFMHKFMTGTVVQSSIWWLVNQTLNFFQYCFPWFCWQWVWISITLISLGSGWPPVCIPTFAIGVFLDSVWENSREPLTWGDMLSIHLKRGEDDARHHNSFLPLPSWL